MERKCKKLIKNMKENLKLDGTAPPRDEGAGDIIEQTRHDSKTHTLPASGSGDNDEEDDDFGYDPERYVPFDEKAEFAESIKKVTKEGLTQIVNLLKEKQPDVLEDFGNERLQIRIDLIEREAFDHCKEILNLNFKEGPNKRMKK